MRAAAAPNNWATTAFCGYLGEGGMGVVYEAVRESLRSHVALKVMHPQYRNRPNYLRRFHTEARSAARLHHTNIVSVFDYGEHDGICYYAMRYIAGQSLDKVLDDIRKLRLENGGLALATPSFWTPDGKLHGRGQRRPRRPGGSRDELAEKNSHFGALDRPVCDRRFR